MGEHRTRNLEIPGSPSGRPGMTGDTMSVTTMPSRGVAQRQPGRIPRLFHYKPFLIVVCLAPALGLLAVFLPYPLALGLWLAFTDTTIGRSGVFVGLENSE